MPGRCREPSGASAITTPTVTTSQGPPTHTAGTVHQVPDPRTRPTRLSAPLSTHPLRAVVALVFLSRP